MTHKPAEQTYYQILDLSPNAAHHDIVAAYQKAKLAYAPDSPALYTMFSKEEAEELLKLIEEAFRILSNQSSRKEYDHLLLNRSRQPTAVDLPDFAPAKENSTEDGAKQVQPARQSPQNSFNIPLSGNIPAGFAKSRLSVYEVNSEIEKEIANKSEVNGAFIRKIRQYKNINLDQLSKETRISRSYLAAIEADDYEALPAPVFLRGFIIQLSRILGLEENQAATSYMSRVKK